MKKLIMVPLMLISLITLVISGCSGPASPTTVPAQTTAPITSAAPTSVAAPTTTPASAPTTISFKVAHYMPAANYMQTQQFPAYFKLLENATKGKYKFDIQYYPAGTLIAPADLYPGFVKGIADMGQAAPDYTPGRFPVMATLMNSGVAPQNDCNAGARIAWEFYKAYKPKELTDVKVLYLYGIGPGALHSKIPIQSVDAMKGLQIRGTGSQSPGIQALGAVPINMTMGESYEAATKGLIDAILSPPETLKAWKFNEVFPYSTLVPGLYFGVQVYAMNLDKYASLPADLQAAINTVADEAVAQTGRIWEYYQQEGYDYAKAGSGGHTVYTLSDADIAEMNSLFQPGVDKYIADLNSKGFPGQEIVNKAKAIADESNKMTYGTWKP
jgi:TRAP-type transport system periplasmic protein